MGWACSHAPGRCSNTVNNQWVDNLLFAGVPPRMSGQPLVTMQNFKPERESTHRHSAIRFVGGN